MKYSRDFVMPPSHPLYSITLGILGQIYWQKKILESCVIVVMAAEHEEIAKVEGPLLRGVKKR